MTYNKDDFDLPGKIETDVAGVYKEYFKLKETLQGIPDAVLKKIGWIDGNNRITIEQLFTHRVSHKSSYFRKRQDANDLLGMLWQSKVTLEANNKLFSTKVDNYSSIDKRLLKEIAKLSVDPRNIPLMPEVLAKHGIILIYQKALPGMKLDGSVFLHASGNPVIGISFRFARLDHFWFTLMHELAHVCLHIDKLDEPILDNFEDSESQEQTIEIQANRVAKFSFVDKPSWRNCKAKYSKQDQDVIEYANSLSIHPAIVAGLLHKEQGNYSRYRDIIDKINTRELVFDDE